jgi:hypothetical protein
MGLGAMLGCAAACSNSAASGDFGMGGAPAVYAPWGNGAGVDPKAGLSGTSSGTTSGAATSGAGGSVTTPPGAGGSGGADQGLTCAATFQPTLTPVLLPYPGARAIGTPALARGLLAAKETPALGAFSANEFLNYYRVQYPKAASNVTSPDGLAVSAGIAQWLTPTEYVIQIGVQAPARLRSSRVALTVVVDTSASMAGASLDRAHAALVALAGGLRAGDSFTLLTSKLGASAPTPIKVTGPADPAVLMAASGLHVDAASVDLGTSVAAAYDAAFSALEDGMLQRVVLITDGVAPPDSINLGLVAGNLKFRAITLTGVGVGAATTYRSKLLAQATAVGSGANVYLDSNEEADRILHLRFDELMDTVVSDVDVSITLPSFLQAESPPVAVPLGGGASDAGFVTSQLGPGRSLVFRQVVVACNTGIVAASTSEDVTIKARWKSPGQTAYTSAPDLKAPTAQLFAADQPQIAKASAIVAYADALRDPLRHARLHVAHDFASDPQLVGDADVAEILGLIESDPAFKK